MKLSSDQIERIRKNVDIVDVINQYVPLTKRGNNYMCSCPFHEDNNPSFSVSQGKQIYKCFSCGRGGDVFSFIEEIEGMTFPQAVVKVSEYTDAPISKQLFKDEEKPQHTLLKDIHKKTAEFYHYYLTKSKKGQHALNYLKNRQMSIEMIEQFQLGLAPLNSDVVYQMLKQAGFEDVDLVDSGIFYQTDEGQFVDRFRGRIIIPIADEHSVIRAFSGRQYDKEAPNQQAKYINSPQTPLFNKSEILFNLNGAKPKMNQVKSVFICEGYMDVIALAQAGFENAVATMGTSLTKQHLKRLTRFVNTIYFLFDGDEAGQEATIRAFEMANEYPKVTFKSLSIPQNMDPDDWIKERGTESFQRLINQATNAYEFQKEFYRNQYQLSDDAEISKYIDQILTIIAQLESPIEQSLRLTDLSEEFQIDLSILQEQLARLKIKSTSSSKSNQSFKEENRYVNLTKELPWKLRSKEAFQSEKYFLFLLIYHEEAWHYIAQLEEPILLINDISCQAYVELQRYYYDLGYQVPLTRISEALTDHSLQTFFNQLLWEYELFPFNEQAMKDTLQVINHLSIRLEIQLLQEELVEAEKQQEYGRVNEILLEISHLNHQTKQ